MTIGERIKQTRKNNHLTQKQLGDLIYISHGHISRVENGFESPSKRLLKLLSVALNVNYEWLLNGDSKKVQAITLGEKMKSIRIESELTQAELGLKMTVSDGCISRIENNFEYPSDMYIALFCSIFNLDKEKLLKGITKCG